MRPRDPYSPGRPPLLKTAAWVIPVTAIAWASADILGASNLITTGIIAAGVLLLIAAEWSAYRHWQTHYELPALLRKNLTNVLRTELPPGSLTTAGHTFGTLAKPGPPKKIKIKTAGLPPMEGDTAKRVLHIASEICENTYILNQKKSAPGKRIVLRQKPKEKTVELSPREAIEQNMAKAAAEIFPKHTPKVACTWDEEIDEDYLLGVTITGVSGMDLSLSGKRRQILVKLRTRLPKGNWISDVDPSEDEIYFRRSRPLPEMVVPPKEQTRPLRTWSDYERFTVPMAVGDEGAQAEWNPRRDAHLLIVGGTGGGKTIAEHGVIQRLTQACWRTWLIDGKQVEFLGYQDWPNVEFLAQDVDSQIRLVYQAYTTMRERYKLIREKKVRIDDLDPIALVIDEVTSLLEFVDERYEETKPRGGKSKAPVLKWLANILRLGRTAKIHLVFGMQRADAQILGGEARDNFGTRITLGKLESKEGSMMIWNDPAIGVSVPKHPGRAVSRINGIPTMVQAAYTANPDVEHPDYHAGMVHAMRPKHEVYSRKAVAEPIPPVGTDSDEISWLHILESKLLDADGNPVEFDPISSEESKQLRGQKPAPPNDDENHLQTGDSPAAGLNLFAYDPLARITYGINVARKLAQLAGEVHVEDAEEPPTSVESQRITGISTESLGESSTTELRYVEPGQNIVVDEIGGEEITVSFCEPDDDDSTIYYLSGWTTDGEAIHVELPADTTVEAFELEPA